MPLMQDYEIEVEVIVRVRNVSTSRSGSPNVVMTYSTTEIETANSYSPSHTITDAVEKCVTKAHKKVTEIARIAKSHEAERLR